MDKVQTIGKDRKKKEFTTKQLIVPAKYFLLCVACRGRAEYPIEISLRSRGGGACWTIGSRLELLQLMGFEDLCKSNFTYIRNFNGMLHIEFSRNGRLEVKKQWLPECAHLTHLTKQDVIRLWKLLFKEMYKESRQQQTIEGGTQKTTFESQLC